MKKILIYVMLMALFVSVFVLPVSAKQPNTENDKYLYFAKYFYLIDDSAEKEDIVTKRCV